MSLLEQGFKLNYINLYIVMKQYTYIMYNGMEQWINLITFLLGHHSFP